MSTLCQLNYSITTGERNKDLKVHTEKQKKFDEMVNEFPKNLAIPIDAAYLKKIARMERSNKNRREKRSGGGGAAKGSGAATPKQEKQNLTVNVTQKGTDFATVVFKKQDFEEKK